MEPRYNEGPRDWQNEVSLNRGSFSYILNTTTGAKYIVRYTEDFVIVQVCYFEVPLDMSGLLGNSTFVNLGKTVLFHSFMI